jgi:hypothetical protein
MHLILHIAGALLAHNAFALTIRSHDAPAQVVMSGNLDHAAPPDTWEEVDISDGWADPRINGGRLLDVSHHRGKCTQNMMSM